MVGLILAAGSGKRLGEAFGKDVCKPLLKVAGKHLIEYSLDNLFSAGVERIYIVISNQTEQVKAVIGNEYRGIPVSYAVQKQPLGLVNAMAAADVIDDDTVLQLSDEILVDSTAPEIKALFDSSDADFFCGVAREDDAEKIKGNYSVKFTLERELITCTEKPSTVENSYKGTGFCVFSRECMRFLNERYNEKKNSPSELCGFINLLTENGKRGKVIEVCKKEYNINTAADAADAENEPAIKAVENE